MSVQEELEARSESKCEMCDMSRSLNVFEVPPTSNGSADESIIACSTCIEQIEDPEKTDPNHWRCLNDTMWSQVPAVQVMIWRMLSRLIWG